jgi:hypothetical protein
VTVTRECEHGLPPGCPLHRPSAARRMAVLLALVVFDVAAHMLVGWGLLAWWRS